MEIQLYFYVASVIEKEIKNMNQKLSKTKFSQLYIKSNMWFISPWK